MRNKPSLLRSLTAPAYVALILVSALAYLPFLFKLGYYFDDWYLMFAAGTRGAGVFWDIFQVDRPGRALVMIPIYSLFGGNPLYYNLNAYLFRVLGAFGFLSFLRTLWPRERGATLIMALYFLVYPGFLSQPNAIDYQSHLAGLAAAMWSIACTLKAVNTTSKGKQLLYFTVSILLGFFYLSQIEWYIGFEATRWACVFLLSMRNEGGLQQKISSALRRAYPVLIIPVFFLAWRLLFFHSERGATDVGLQLGGLRSAPLATFGLWAISLAKDLVHVLLLAWVLPLSQYAFTMDTINKLIGLTLGALAITVTLISLKREENVDGGDQPQDPDWKREAMWLGLAALVFGLVPVVLANREVSFPSYSRYTLASSAGAVMMIVAVMHELSNVKLRLTMISILVLFSILTHYGNGFEHARWAEEYRNFWWQVSWRIPQLQKNTTLIAQYPTSGTEEDYFIWGPANLIYATQSANDRKVQPALFAALLNQGTAIRVLLRDGQDFTDRRSIVTYTNYRNVLAIAQPTPGSCVRVIDGTQVELSSSDHPLMMLIAPYSEADRIMLDDSIHIPPLIPFGKEPPHGWCYYYEAADLARQHGVWEMVVELGAQAFEQGLKPRDVIEWLPFLQAYAVTGEVNRLMELAPIVTADRFVALQACRILGVTPGLSTTVIETIDSLYCLE